MHKCFGKSVTSLIVADHKLVRECRDLFRDSDFVLKLLALMLVMLALMLPMHLKKTVFTESMGVELRVQVANLFYTAANGALIALSVLLLLVVVDEERHYITMFFLFVYSAFLLMVGAAVLVYAMRYAPAKARLMARHAPVDPKLSDRSSFAPATTAPSDGNETNGNGKTKRSAGDRGEPKHFDVREELTLIEEAINFDDLKEPTNVDDFKETTHVDDFKETTHGDDFKTTTDGDDFNETTHGDDLREPKHYGDPKRPDADNKSKISRQWIPGFGSEPKTSFSLIFLYPIMLLMAGVLMLIDLLLEFFFRTC